MKIELNEAGVAIIGLVIICFALYRAKRAAEAKTRRIWAAWKRGIDGKSNWAADVQ